MGKRKPKVEAKPQFSESDHAEMEANPLGMRVAMGLTNPQPMSEARLEELRDYARRGVFDWPCELVAEIDRLRAEVAAKDAEIARLTAELNVARFMNTPMDNLPAPE